MHTTPLILVTNDDGVGSPGLWAAVQGALLLGDVIVAAPHTQQTGMGRAFPRTPDLGIIEKMDCQVQDVRVPTYGVHGSPAYAAAYGILELAPRRPDLCISGINYGENVGMTLTCSGTLGAAFEASSHGIPALAVSVQADLAVQRSNEFQELDWEIPREVVAQWARFMLSGQRDRRIDWLNVNIPSGVRDSSQYRITTQSRLNYFEFCKPPKRDQGRPYPLQTKHWVDEEALEKESDIHAVYRERLISITPLSTVMSLPSDVVGGI